MLFAQTDRKLISITLSHMHAEGNYDMHPQDMNALDRATTSAGKTSVSIIPSEDED